MADIGNLPSPGQKPWSLNPAITAINAEVEQATSAILTKASDSEVVKLSGAQTVAGVKTFSSAPSVPDGSFSIAKTTGLQTALDNAGSAPPSYAGSSRVGTYSKSQTRYTPRDAVIGKAKSSLSRAALGTGVSKILCLGESTVAGVPGTRGTNSWPAQLESLLSSQGFAAGPGLVPAGSFPHDPRWVLNGFTDSYPSLTGANGYFSARSTVTGSTATFTSLNSGTIVDILYQTTSGNGSFTYSLDGAAAVTVNTNTSQSNSTVTLAGLTNTVHSVVITHTAGGPITITGAIVRNTSGVQISNIGVGSTVTGWWTGEASWFSAINLAKYLTPDLTIIGLGINDRNNSVSTTSTTANLNTIANALRSVGSDVIFLNPNRINVSATSAPSVLEDPYYNAIYNAADTQSAPLIDCADRLGSYSVANAAGDMADTYHPSVAGYGKIAKAVRQLLLN